MKLVSKPENDPRHAVAEETLDVPVDEEKEQQEPHKFNYPITEDYAALLNSSINDIAMSLKLQGIDMSDPKNFFDVLQTVKEVVDRQIIFYLLDKVGVKSMSEIISQEYMQKVKESFKVQRLNK